MSLSVLVFITWSGGHDSPFHVLLVRDDDTIFSKPDIYLAFQVCQEVPLSSCSRGNAGSEPACGHGAAFLKDKKWGTRAQLEVATRGSPW